MVRWVEGARRGVLHLLGGATERKRENRDERAEQILALHGYFRQTPSGCNFRIVLSSYPQETRMSFPRNTVVALLIAFAASVGCTAATKTPIPAPANDSPLAQTPGKQTAVFAGGCFWGTQSVFERVKGVLATTAGYSGGSACHCDLRTGWPGEHRARGISEGRLRPFEDNLWPAAADLLFRGSRPHPAQSARSGCR